MAKRIKKQKPVGSVKQMNKLDYIARRIKIVPLGWQEQELVKGAQYACEHIAEEIKAGKVTSAYSAPSERVNHIWIATCQSCVQAASWKGERSEAERKLGEERDALWARPDDRQN